MGTSRVSTLVVVTALGSGLVMGTAGFAVGWFSAGDRASPETGEDEATPAVGMPADPERPPKPGPSDDGVFDYTISSVTTAKTYKENACGETHVTNNIFVVAGIEFENLSSEPAAPKNNVTAYENDGTGYGSRADICSGTSEIQPGKTGAYFVVLEVPEDTELDVMELSAENTQDVAVVEIPQDF